jgi:glycosyltransferase involved in cell wall biosynthesis
VIFAGDLDLEVKSRISELGLDVMIDTPGVVSHFDSLRLMLLSNLLLLFDPQDDGKTYVRSKLYEYLGSGKMILGMVPGGASRKLLERSGRGLMASPDDAEAIKQAIRYAFEHRDSLTTDAGLDMMVYERKNLTKELASLLDSLR